MWSFTRTLFVIFVLSSSNLCLAEDYYELLGVSRDADNRDIRRAFKKLALKLHPDKNKDDPNANESFIKINKAYEVLKDEETRKKYDLHGEEGLKDDFGTGWRGSFRSWNYYYESFGIYDDDPEIITLSTSDFEQSVNARAAWFINFYSPQCSHCHHLAPAWRALARELEGVIRIGAVNCEEDWMLCRQQNIHSYPSLVMYPEKTKYRGSRETDAMVEYVLSLLPNTVIDLTAHNFREVVSREDYKVHPWLISVCKNDEECLASDALQKLSLILEGLVNVAVVDYELDRAICDFLDCSSAVTLYSNLSLPSESVVLPAHKIQETEVKGILSEVLMLLPGATEMTEEMFWKIRQDVDPASFKPWLILFTKSNMEDTSANMDTELKKLRALLPGVGLAQVSCQDLATVCSSLHLRKYPVFIVFKAGAYEFHYGRLTAHDIASFVRESLSSRVEALGPQDFSSKVIDSQDTWFVDFFAPWCPPCMQLLPEYRKVSRSMGHKIRFGTVDCTMHESLCSKYNIRSYPTTILYNLTTPHQYHGSHTAGGLEEFIKDTLNPLVVPLSPDSFNDLVMSKAEDEIWVIDYFAPWCGPCQQLAPEWSKLARMLTDEPSVHVGSIDCQLHRDLCSSQGVNTYPNIRIYPRGSFGVSKFSSYNGWNRDANSLRVWIYGFLPSTVASLSSSDFFKKLLTDSKPWVVDFYAPWCGHCQVFAPEFERVAKALEGKAKAGKINCVELPHVCQKADIRAYPTVLYYAGSYGGQTQHPIGEELYTTSADAIISFVEKQVKLQKDKRRRDEL